ncbi:MAG: Efflux transporter, family, subunit [Chthoniobacteraceae bacterium]|nr:Efflux transporter, family, subunit [Chthoniobacteraceae bacterium]
MHHIHALIVTALALCLLPACKREDEAKSTLPPPTMLVIPAGTRDVPLYREWIGTLDGSENAEVRARVTGYLLKRDYKEGTLVKQGDVLFEIDPRPFEVALAEAQSQLAQGKAMQLASQAEAERSKALFNQKVISKKEFINKTQLNQSHEAKVKALEASVKQAELNLQFCTIMSPIDGIVAIAKAQVGDLVGAANGPALTSVSTLDPVKLVFPISEEEYLLVRERVEKSMSKPLEERDEMIELILANGKTFEHKARLLSIDLQVKQSTGTILITALLKNPGSVLRPGQFARARVIAQTLEDAVLVPQRAVAEVQGSYQVGIVDPNGKAEIRPVKVGARDGTDWVITSGLKAGEKVIVEGIQMVKSGMPVEAKPWVPPEKRPAAPAKEAKPAAKH